ncbi:MAG: hypothetical protein KBT03_07575 [Bacteroidales bacterium]|nr:hypothetical protein [Candidatus Scybalousia scybalohippi]
MNAIKGIQVELVNKIQCGTDEANRPIYEDRIVKVDNVLVAPTSQEDIVNQLNLTGKHAIYTLGIPKGDNHVWQDQEVMIFGKRYKVFTPEIQGIEEMVPLLWNKKVMVERYEQ